MPLLGLAPDEVYPAGRSPDLWWALTPPFHPYRLRAGGVVSVALSAGHPAWALPSVLPCGARTFLGWPEPPAAARPAHLLLYHIATAPTRKADTSHPSHRSLRRGATRLCPWWGWALLRAWWSADRFSCNMYDGSAQASERQCSTDDGEDHHPKARRRMRLPGRPASSMRRWVTSTG